MNDQRTFDKPTREEYRDIAEKLLQRNDTPFPIILEALKKAGFELGEYNVAPKVTKPKDPELVELLNQYSLPQLVRILNLPKSTIQYYRTGTYKPQEARRKYIIETLNHRRN